MAIEFESPKPIVQMQTVLKTVAQEMMRSKSVTSTRTSMRFPGIILSLYTLP